MLISPYGKYHYTRLPFGLNMVHDTLSFQARIKTEGLEVSEIRYNLLDRGEQRANHKQRLNV